MRGVLAAGAFVLIVTSAAVANAQTFVPPIVPGPVTGDDPKRTLLVASILAKSQRAESVDLAKLENLAAIHRLQTQPEPRPGGPWLWLLVSAVGAAAIWALQRVRHYQPDEFC